ncbi:adenylyltransferase/cytidyltransferase family protein [Asanoa sp. WMMD1127]|uniref:adenylyltransferase/cytidyltransferase family protein n=1 Tax=Asanoa sp. WMMD1127 TaxID=3016107 RepID=UPI00241768D1|nr:adenylyltransferase/cytidyltransferase family protein [Asanoa sp. WMMD1127]MDG4823977.1 adenylyltransferase/cytidyltransferase family protein [Asanoa sp. WMMD1127]
MYVDMAGDLFHCGHVNLLKAARELGDSLVVGVLDDETIAHYKRKPIMSLDERVAVIGACRFVDEVIAPAPFRVTSDFIRSHDISLVAHGDDLPLEAVHDIYGAAASAGIFRYVPRTAAVSTTEIIRRVLERAPARP